MLESVQKALKHLRGSFINHNNEIILIPKFNVYTLLDDVETDDDFKVKLCEWFSRDCCCALRYSQNKRLERYYQEYLLGYSQDANWENYDMDMQMTKDHVEQILEAGYIDESEIDFVKSLLPEIENDRIREDLEEYLESLMIL